MPYFGNAEMPLSKLTTLARYFELTQEDDMAELFIKPLTETYTASQVLHIIQVVANLNPDECALEDDRLRLWWD